jgi:hypothetical protein
MPKRDAATRTPNTPNVGVCESQSYMAVKSQRLVADEEGFSGCVDDLGGSVKVVECLDSFTIAPVALGLFPSTSAGRADVAVPQR